MFNPISRLHNYIPDPILFNIGPFTIYWYGLLLGLAFLIAFSIFYKIYKDRGLNVDDTYNSAFYTVLGALIGARIYYVIYAWSLYKNDFFSIFKVWEGGLAIHGVIIGGLIGLYIYCRKYKQIGFWSLLDLAIIGVPIGQAIGRWGNFFNQELFGKPTDLFWGIIIEPINRPEQYSGLTMATYFHPTFLYESILNIFVFIILYSLYKFYIKKENTNYKPGMIFIVYVILYSMIRFSMEFLRVDYSPIFFGIRWAQFISGALVISGIVALVLLYRKPINSKS